MKPIIVYVDDQPNNLTLFEMELSERWDVRTFTNPLEALSAIEKLQPSIIVSDQRMPGLSGVDYLELTRKIHPHAVRIIVTGYSDEDLVVESVRRAQILDYIKKPLDDKLEARIEKAYEYFKANEDVRLLTAQLKTRNEELTKLSEELKTSNDKAVAGRKELESWVHPSLLKLLENKNNQFPMKRDLVGITFDIISGSEYHDVTIDGRPLMNVIIEAFSKTILAHGGCRESMPGDSVYGHFGILDDGLDPFQLALSAAQEFRVKLRSLSNNHSISIECGIALHLAKGSIIDVHEAEVRTKDGILVQKSFGTSSIDIDLLHRMEKIVHELPGTNIIMSDIFLKSLKSPPPRLLELGSFTLRGQTKPQLLHIIGSDKLDESSVPKLREKLVVLEQEVVVKQVLTLVVA